MKKFILKYPLAPWSVSQEFGKNDVPLYKQLGMKGHNGIDVGCQVGTAIYAAHDGIVAFTGEDSSGGLGVVLRTIEEFEYKGKPSLYKSIYWHVKANSFKVKPGDIVRCGDQIAEADTTGAATASHLHFGIKPIVQGENDWVWYNLAQTEGYLGAIDPFPYFDGTYAHLTNSYKFTTSLSLGQTNLDIGRLQKLLQILGYFPKDQPISNYYGNITRKAVLAFQYGNKVASFAELYALQGSICGVKTIKALNLI